MRIRTIKPEFFANDELAQCSPLARLLFVGLWCMADRRGRLEDRPRRIGAQLLPYDGCDAEDLLAELDRGGFITRYRASGLDLIQIDAFEKHQRITGKESETESEYPPVSVGETTGKQRGNTREATETTGREGKGREGKGGTPSSLCSEGVVDDPSVIDPPASAFELEPCDPATDQPRPKRRIDETPYDAIIATWGQICPHLPQPAIPTEARKTRLRAFWQRALHDSAARGVAADTWVSGLFEIVAKSDFLSGRIQNKDRRAFRADLWWVILPEHAANIIEGRYDNERPA
jgi:hypothetical protein